MVGGGRFGRRYYCWWCRIVAVGDEQMVWMMVAEVGRCRCVVIVVVVVERVRWWMQGGLWVGCRSRL